MLMSRFVFEHYLNLLSIHRAQIISCLVQNLRASSSRSHQKESKVVITQESRKLDCPQPRVEGETWGPMAKVPRFHWGVPKLQTIVHS